MNWKLIIQLSLFGFIMAFATVFFIPANIEWMFWLVIFIICAFFIAKNAPGKYFLHGFMVSIFNCIWITTVHILFYETYIMNHREMLDMSADMPMYMQENPRILMAISGPVTGVLSGLVLGLFSFVASKIVKKRSF